MIALGQLPNSVPGQYDDPAPWVGDDAGAMGGCDNTEADIVTHLGWCRTHPGTAACMQRYGVCDNLQAMANWPSKMCSTKNVESVFANETVNCTGLGTPTPLTNLLAVKSVEGLATKLVGAIDSAKAAAMLRFQADQRTAAASWVLALSKQINQLDKLHVRPGNRMVTPLQTKDIQAQIKQIAGASPAVSSNAAGTVTTAGQGTLELSLVPSMKSATTGPVTPIGPATVDCSTMPCIENWVTAKVPTKDGTITAWLPADQVEPAKADCALPLSYAGDKVILSDQELSSLRALFSQTCIGPNSVIRITAVLSDGSNNDSSDLLRAKERAEFVSNFLLDHLSDPSNVRTTFVRTQSAGPAAPITIEVFGR